MTDGTWTYTWEHGRQLASMSNGTSTWTYTYDANGMRTSRTDGTTSYSYIYNGGQLVQETVTSGASQSVLNYFYDAGGSPLYVVYNNVPYFYVLNLQGDVVALISASGTKVVEYTYDAWGNILTTTGALASTLGQDNSLRYRAYVYDQESELYYLQSRYYDPEVGRFLNADAYTSTGQGILGNNMFAYCLNNPIMYTDQSGTDAILIYEAKSAGGFGHIGLLVQDSEGNWFYFYWGPVNPEAVFWDMLFYTDEICIFLDLGMSGPVFKSLDDIRAALEGHPLSKEPRIGEQSSHISHMIYLEGDYTATYEYLENLSKKDNLESPLVQYSLLCNNCSQQSLRALGASNPIFYGIDSLIPIYAYFDVLALAPMLPGINHLNDKFHKNYHRTVIA